MNIAIGSKNARPRIVFGSRHFAAQYAGLDEDAQLEKALRAVERDRYLAEHRRVADVLLAGFSLNPFDANGRW